MKELTRVNDIRFLVDKLKLKHGSMTIENQYLQERQSNNLYHYLKNQKDKDPLFLMLGEAGGYRGCAKTGIPFTSGYLLRKSRLFAKYRKDLMYQDIEDLKEKTASIVFSLFHIYPEIFDKIIMFNAFPLHPHVYKNKQSNRKPLKEELNDCFPYLDDLLLIFDRIDTILLIGKTAEHFFNEFKTRKNFFSIRNKTYKTFTIRHPSYGGKKEFISKMKSVFNLKMSNQRTLL